MSKFTLFPFVAAILLVLAAGAGPARAQAPDGLIIRSFVSAGGNDAHGCTRPAPCRTLSAALAKTAAGGTISIIDAGGYGTVTILVPQGEIGVFVKDPFYEARVYLRGLTIEGANVGSTGVFVSGARAVSVENCVIRNLFGGILFEPESSNVASNKPFMAQSALTVANTTIADIGGVAVLILPGDIGVVKAALRGVRVFNNLQMGIQVLGGASRHPIDVAISDSLVTQNGQGIVANTSTTQAPVKVMVTGSTVAHSFFTGLQASASPPDPDQPDIKSIAEIWIGQSTVFGNTTGVEATGGALLRSFGDNYIAGNQTDGTFTATVPRR